LDVLAGEGLDGAEPAQFPPNYIIKTFNRLTLMVTNPAVRLQPVVMIEYPATGF
jgi:hypothetical protein